MNEARIITEYPNRLEWLAARRSSLGASEVASVVGEGFSSALELWKEKRGLIEHPDLSTNPRVAYGTAAEEYLRALFALQFDGTYTVEYHPYRVYKNVRYPFLTATLDGELMRESDGKHGIWECKTAWIMSKADLDRWGNNSIPQHYYCQVCQQLGVTEFDFVVLTAQLIFTDGHSEIRHYTIERAEVENDIKFVQGEAVKFWRYVESGKQPPQRLTL